MKTLNISQKRFDKLPDFKLDSSISNTESTMHVLTEKNRWDKQTYLLKKLYNDSDLAFSNKLFTVSQLIYNKDKIGMEELVLPSELVSIHGKTVGFTIPYVNSENFQLVLNSWGYSKQQKIDYLKEVGQILERMKLVREYHGISDFYINDLHENNFILNKTTGKINVVDMDSCKINGNLPFAARFLSPVSNIYDVAKYQQIDNPMPSGGVYKIDENTDLYCYIIMILNFVSNSRINRVSIDEYYDYLSYLHSIGVSYELLDLFSLVYTGHDNVNPYEYLDELVNVIGRSSYKVYQLIKKK